MSLKARYEKSCMEYIEAFEADYFEFWVGGRVGGIVAMGDYFFDFQEIKYCVDNNIPCEKLYEFYDHFLDHYWEHKTFVNFESWLKGCPQATYDYKGWDRRKRIFEAAINRQIKKRGLK